MECCASEETRTKFVHGECLEVGTLCRFAYSLGHHLVFDGGCIISLCILVRTFTLETRSLMYCAFLSTLFSLPLCSIRL